MKSKNLILPACLFMAIFTGWNAGEWIAEKNKQYTYFYKEADRNNKDAYSLIINNSIKTVEQFFNEPYKKPFEIYIHPDRASLDVQWQTDWKDTGFKSECWMVASGTGFKLDLLSPQVWDKQACEHRYVDSEKTQKLICHELFHVFHGQLNASPDFSGVENIDWFVEGFATYASGQCDSTRMAEVKSSLLKNEIPASLDNFWKGKLKYGLSGSVVMYIDATFGRKVLHELLACTNKNNLFAKLGMQEDSLLTGWKKFMNDLVIH